MSNTSRIAKNTLLLYFRMLLTMAVSLYTSRVILSALGVEDYGIYNVVGGLITAISFLNSAMVSATMRFFAFEMGRGGDKLQWYFSTSIVIQIVICSIAIVVGEIFGLWFVNNKLVIPDGRIAAANWVFQASILTFVFNVMSVPYNSSIVAHEKMSAFAYIGILEVVLKLLIVFLLYAIPFDKLATYSVLLVLVAATIRMCYVIYCKRHFDECRFRRGMFDKKIFREMFSFGSWSLVGNLGYSIKKLFKFF